MWITFLAVGTMWKWAVLRMLRINFCLDGSGLCLHASSTMYQHVKMGCAVAHLSGYKEGVPGQIFHTLGEHSLG